MACPSARGYLSSTPRVVKVTERTEDYIVNKKVESTNY
jgi:hypothetical protein